MLIFFTEIKTLLLIKSGHKICYAGFGITNRIGWHDVRIICTIGIYGDGPEPRV